MNWQIAKVCLVFFSLNIAAFKIQAEGFLPYISDGCMQALPQARAPVFELACMPYPSSERVATLLVPMRVLNWGSGGKGGIPWRFKDERCNDFFSTLQTSIVEAFPDIRESPHDLFHAHLIGYGKNNKQMAAVFHAKEYPRDLERIKNYYQVAKEAFLSTDASFKTRNFVYIANDAEVPQGMYQVSDRGACQELFLEYAKNTLSEEKLRVQLVGIKVGDVNIFQTKNLARIKYNNYSTYWNSEEKNSGKSYGERMCLNEKLIEWIAGVNSEKVLFFLTGYEG